MPESAGACIPRPCTHSSHHSEMANASACAPRSPCPSAASGAVTFAGDLDPAFTSSSTVISAPSIATHKIRSYSVCSCKPCGRSVAGRSSCISGAWKLPCSLHTRRGETRRTAVTCLRLHSPRNCTILRPKFWISVAHMRKATSFWHHGNVLTTTLRPHIHSRA